MSLENDQILMLFFYGLLWLTTLLSGHHTGQERPGSSGLLGIKKA